MSREIILSGKKSRVQFLKKREEALSLGGWKKKGDLEERKTLSI